MPHLTETRGLDTCCIHVSYVSTVATNLFLPPLGPGTWCRKEMSLPLPTPTTYNPKTRVMDVTYPTYERLACLLPYVANAHYHMYVQTDTMQATGDISDGGTGPAMSIGWIHQSIVGLASPWLLWYVAIQAWESILFTRRA